MADGSRRGQERCNVVRASGYLDEILFSVGSPAASRDSFPFQSRKIFVFTTRGERERPALLSFRSWPRVLEGVSKVCRAKERRSLSFSSSSFFSLNKYPRLEKKGEKSTIKTIRTFVPSKGTISLSSRGIPFRREDVCRKPPRFNPKNGSRQKRGKSLLRPNWNDRDVNGGDAQRRP